MRVFNLEVMKRAKTKSHKAPIKKKLLATELKSGRNVNKKDAFADFVRWSVLSTKERKQANLPPTQKAFAQYWQLDEATCVDWKKREDYKIQRADAIKLNLADKTPEVLNALYTRIKKYGMSFEVELWLAYVEGWDKKTILEHRDQVEFGDGDIRELISHLPEKEQQQFYDVITKLLVQAEEAKSANLERKNT